MVKIAPAVRGEEVVAAGRLGGLDFGASEVYVGSATSGPPTDYPPGCDGGWA